MGELRLEMRAVAAVAVLGLLCLVSYPVSGQAISSAGGGGSGVAVQQAGGFAPAEGGSGTSVGARIVAAFNATDPAALGAMFSATMKSYRDRVAKARAEGRDVAKISAALDGIQGEWPRLAAAAERGDAAGVQEVYDHAVLKWAGVESVLAAMGGKQGWAFVSWGSDYGLEGDARASDAVGSPLSIEGGGKVMFVKSVGQGLVVRIPVLLAEGGVLKSFTSDNVVYDAGVVRVKLKDAEGAPVGELVAKVRQAVGSEAGAEARVDSLHLVTVERSAELALEGAGASSVASTSLDIALSAVPSEAGVDFGVGAEVPAEAVPVFQGLAGENGLELVAQGPVVQVDAKALSAKDVGGAVIRIGVDRSWVMSNGGIPAVKVLRYSPESGRREILETAYSGGNGSMLYFEAASSGLSVFALYVVQTAPKRNAVVEVPSPTPVPSIVAGAVSTAEFDVMGMVEVVIVVLFFVAAYFFYSRKRTLAPAGGGEGAVEKAGKEKAKPPG